MKDNQSTAESVRAYEVVADCYVAGRAFSRGDRVDSRKLAEMRRVLLAAGLIREIESPVLVA